jgi:hypothetical protein
MINNNLKTLYYSALNKSRLYYYRLEATSEHNKICVKFSQFILWNSALINAGCIYLEPVK